MSLVKTSGMPGFLGEARRGNVAFTPHMIGLYVIGHHDYWFSQKKTGYTDVNTNRR